VKLNVCVVACAGRGGMASSNRTASGSDVVTARRVFPLSCGMVFSVRRRPACSRK
jgi:hypothetical protein